jgi:hypothetical protein
VEVMVHGALQCPLWLVHDDGRDPVVFSWVVFDFRFKNFFQKIKAEKTERAWLSK